MKRCIEIFAVLCMISAILSLAGGGGSAAAQLDQYGPLDGKRALSYEFCIPDTEQHRTEVKRIDPTVKFFAQSPGRIGCGKDENLCIGSPQQKDIRGVLQRLAELMYVQRIDESFFE